MISEINVNDFDLKVLKSEIPVFVLFTTPSAPHQYDFIKLLDELSDQTIYRCDVEKNYSLAVKYSVRIVPSLYLFKEGVFVESKSLATLKTSKDILGMLD